MRLCGKTAFPLALAAVFAVLALPRAGAAQDLKVGYIRPQYIFSKYEPYKEAQKQMDAFERTEKEKLQKMTDEFQKKVKETESQALLMTEEILKVKREELEKQKQQLDSYYNDLYKSGGKLESKQKELIGPILDRINGVLMRVGRDDGYDYIFDGEGPVLYANPKHDLSDYILEELKKETPEK